VTDAGTMGPTSGSGSGGTEGDFGQMFDGGYHEGYWKTKYNKTTMSTSTIRAHRLG